jgi:hypothetical protein
MHAAPGPSRMCAPHTPAETIILILGPTSTHDSMHRSLARCLAASPWRCLCSESRNRYRCNSPGGSLDEYTALSGLYVRALKHDDMNLTRSTVVQVLDWAYGVDLYICWSHNIRI